MWAACLELKPLQMATPVAVYCSIEDNWAAAGHRKDNVMRQCSACAQCASITACSFRGMPMLENAVANCELLLEQVVTGAYLSRNAGDACVLVHPRRWQGCVWSKLRSFGKKQDCGMFCSVYLYLFFTTTNCKAATLPQLHSCWTAIFAGEVAAAYPVLIRVIISA